MRFLLYILYSLYLLLLLMTSLVPENRWNSVWIVGILAFTTISFFQVSERYGTCLKLFDSRLYSYSKCPPTNCRFFCTGNPMKLRSKAMGQTPYVSNACVDTEIAVTAVFARTSSTTIGLGGDTGMVAGRGMTFKLGL